MKTIKFPVPNHCILFNCVITQFNYIIKYKLTNIKRITLRHHSQLKLRESIKIIIISTIAQIQKSKYRLKWDHTTAEVCEKEGG